MPVIFDWEEDRIFGCEEDRNSLIIPYQVQGQQWLGSREINVETDECQGVDVGPFHASSSNPSTPAVPLGANDSNDNVLDSRNASEEDEDYNDDVYDFSSEDEDFQGEGDENLDQNNVIDFMAGVNVEQNSNDSFSDFESDFEDNNYPNSEHNFNSDEDRDEGHVDKSTSRVFDQNLYGNEFKVVEGQPIVLSTGLLFEDVYQFRQVLKDFTVQKGCKIVRDKNEKCRVTAHCADAFCKWRIHASPLPDGVTYMIKSYGTDHTCIRLHATSEANSAWIAKKMEETLRSNPDMKLDSMQTHVQKTYGIEVTKMQLYRARRRALDEIEGRHGRSYKLLPIYANEIRKTNPGSLVKMDYDRPSLLVNPTFKRIFIGFEALFNGFKAGCRPFIGIDGCHLKGPYGGVLLAAVSLDGNNGLFPIAFGVVESEGRDSWGFFLEHLNTIIGAHSYQVPWTFMSDQQKGLDRVIAEIFPEASHRRCCRHLCNNMRSRYPGLLIRRYFWRAARAYNEVDFKEAMNLLGGVSPDARTWLMRLPIASWSRHAFDPRLKNDHVTNNLTESFNNWILNLRCKPILTMLEGIRSKLMSRIRQRYEKGQTWEGIVTPNMKKKLSKIVEASRQCTILFAGGMEFEVKDGEGVTFVVDLDARSCVCRAWQIGGLPCKHAAAAIAYKRCNIEEYCDVAFFKARYLAAHQHILHPVVDPRMWNTEGVVGDPIDPPPLRRLPGRPKKNRRREADEDVGSSQARRALSLRCTNCNQFGHNRRTCQRAPVRGRGQNSRHNRGRREQTMTGGEGHAATVGSQGNASETVTQEFALGQGRGAIPPQGRGRGKGRAAHSQGTAPSQQGLSRGKGIQGRSTSIRGRGAIPSHGRSVHAQRGERWDKVPCSES
uniref:SWIM-type domain-containing protein n=1 Tax=Davidia involucrata TaxID=16924 RepID=A0A5B7ARQ4_DAVIN